jgi:hypothetical protein
MLKILKSISLVSFVSYFIGLTALFFFSGNSACYSQENKNYIPQETINKSYYFLYNFQFKKADSIISETTKNYPLDPFSKVLEANKYWWLLLSVDESNKELSRNFLSTLTEAENLLVKNKNNYSERDLFLLINVHGYKARLDLLNQNYLAILKNLDMSIGFIKSSNEKSTTYEPLFFTSGLYNYFMGKAKITYWFAFPLLSTYPEADKWKGIEMLKTCSFSKDKLIQTEADYFLMKIYLESEKNATLAMPFAQALIEQYPNNIIFQYYYYKILLNKGDVKLISEQLVRFNTCFENSELNTDQIIHFQKLIHKELIEFFRKNKKVYTKS